MKTTSRTIYQCEICQTQYDSEDQAKYCESKPISQDKGVKIGDIVLIKRGEGAGKKAKVDHISIINKDWGHYAAERYHHTPMITAKIINDWGSRSLTFDDYELATA